MVSSQIWSMGKCDKCYLTFYEFTLEGQGKKIMRICGCYEGIQETSGELICIVNSDSLNRKHLKREK
jgi:hypothetical protein